ncbi:hypothetical protein NHF46_02160 [Arthrobacter alpinus]|nr:hypothetical protein [Arthrobacter alpinus]
MLAWAMEHSGGLPVNFVGHSFGGFGVGMAEHAAGLSRILTVGAQHAYWRDLTLRRKAGHWGRAAVMLPLVAVMGYFPAKRLRLMEDLPAGVALDWARSRKDFTTAAAGSCAIPCEPIKLLCGPPSWHWRPMMMNTPPFPL